MSSPKDSKGSMSKNDWLARAEIYSELADHLDMSWNDDSAEREQGEIVSRLLRVKEIACRRIADRLI